MPPKKITKPAVKPKAGGPQRKAAAVVDRKTKRNDGTSTNGAALPPKRKKDDIDNNTGNSIVSTFAPKGKMKKIADALKEGIQALSIGQKQETLIGREKEVENITKFLLGADTEPTLQLFGLPGTGKTAAVRLALSNIKQDDENVSVCFLNGYVMQRPAEVYTTLYRRLSADRLGTEELLSPDQAQAQLEKRFRHGWTQSTKRNPELLPLCVIVVDEVDRCVDKSGKTLFRLVDWMTLPHTRCKLLTIANKFNLPEQMDAKTRSRMNTTQRVTFLSYSAEQLQAIVEARVSHIKPAVLAPSAIAYLCNLVAGQFGDTRRLLQTTSSALHSRLIQLAEDGELGNEIADGIVAIQHLRGIVRNIFHDPFGDFIKSIENPLPFLACGVIALETRKCDAALASPRIDSIYLHTQMLRAITQFRVVMELTPEGSALASLEVHELLPIEEWYQILQKLWEVKLIALSTGDDEDSVAVNTLHECLTSIGTVFVTLEQPFDMVITTMELHDKWSSQAVKLFRTGQ